ncbi:MAG: glycosyltransferase [Armatimonadota bacterium]|nr:glycosyltransferase [Armatimonadota bacterium]MDR7512867.1 glycosyltransferase [Armatimonadota bacterium]
MTTPAVARDPAGADVDGPALTVIIPTRNERETVGPLVEALSRALAGRDYELVFVDDSTDGTDAALEALAHGEVRIRVHHRARGDGLAGAVVAGFGLARGAVVGVIDADLQHPPEMLAVLLERLEATGADVVVASRYLPGAGRPGLRPLRAAISQLLRLFSKVMLRAARRTTDPLSGFFLVRRRVIDGIALRPVGFKILLEVLVRGRVDRVVDVPYVFGERGGGRTKAGVRQGVALFQHVARLAASNPADARLWKFLLVGASGAVVNMAVFGILIGPLGVYYVLAGAVAGAVSTFTNFVLNNAFTWADRREAAWSVFVRRLGKYYVATWVGYAAYLGLLWAITQVGIAPMVSNLIAIGVGGMLNYVMHNVWTWRERRVH